MQQKISEIKEIDKELRRLSKRQRKIISELDWRFLPCEIKVKKKFLDKN